MKIDPKEITKEFADAAKDLQSAEERFALEAAAMLDPELVKRAAEFEKEWTARGVPPLHSERSNIGFTVIRLIKHGCPRSVLHGYIDAVIAFVAEMQPDIEVIE